MKHKLVYYEETTKRGFLGIPRKVKEKKVVYVDGKTWRKLKRVYNNRPFGWGEMLFYDCVFDDE